MLRVSKQKIPEHPGFVTDCTSQYFSIVDDGKLQVIPTIVPLGWHNRKYSTGLAIGALAKQA